MSLSTTPRPTYTGERTDWTVADGTYHVTLTVPAYKVHREDKPGCQVVNEEVARGLGIALEGAGISSTVGYVGQIGTGYSAIFATFTVQADSDHDALALVLPAAVSASACGTTIRYMQPDRTGGSTRGDHNTVVDVRPAATIENLPAELRLV